MESSESKSSGKVAISDRASQFQAPMVVSEIADNCLYSGFFGRLDSARVKSITDRLLSSVDKTGIEKIIIDLSNIDVIDSLVANHLLRIGTTLQLVGVKAFFCGISPTVAQTMVSTGVDVTALNTHRNLKSAIQAL